MKKTQCRAKVWLIPMLFVIALCMGALAIFTLQPVKAEAPVYEVTGFRNSNTKGNANSFYALATYADTLERKWEINYEGTGYLNGTAKTVNFRLIPGTGENVWFDGVGATKAGDVFKVGGIFARNDSADYTLNLEENEFVYDGGNVWKIIEKVDEKPAANVMLDADGVEAKITVAGVAATVVPDNGVGVFPGATGSTKMSYTEGIAAGGTATVSLGKKYLAKNFSSVNVKMVVGSWGGTSNVITTTAYAVTDTGFANPAGSVQTKDSDNGIATLEVDASVIVDAEGYIDSFVIRRPETSGQLFFDYVELVLSNEDDTEYDQPVVLTVDGKDVTMTPGEYGVVDGIVSDATGVVVGYTPDIGNNTVIKFKLAKRYKAANFSTLSVSIAATNWTSGNTVTTTMYALSDTERTNPLASVETTTGMGRANVSATASELADADGYVSGFYLVKTQTDPNDKGWQFFAGTVTLNPPAYTMTVKDGESITTQAVVKGNSFAVASINAANTETHIVAGYKINGKLYSADYSFVPAADTEIEVVRVAFRVVDGAMIKYVGKGLRFVISLNEADYNAVKSLVSEGNIFYGVTLIKIAENGADGKSVSKRADKFYVEDGVIKFNGLISEYPETAEAYTAKFRARGFLSIKYEDKAEAVTVYANEPAAADGVRSIYDVAKAAIAAGVTGEALEACRAIVDTVELSNTNLPDYSLKKKI